MLSGGFDNGVASQTYGLGFLQELVAINLGEKDAYFNSRVERCKQINYPPIQSGIYAHKALSSG